MSAIDYSIQEIKTGVVPADGVTEGVMVAIAGNIDSEDAGFEVEEAEKLEKTDLRTGAIYIELESKKAVTSFHYNQANITPENLLKALGGSVTGDVWKAPINAYNGIETMLRL